MRLLICDDHEALLEALSMALTQRGHTVVATALDPRDAVAAASEHQPDACLLDVNFPHANGLSAIARIHEVSGHTKVVILSASSDRGLVAAAMAQGAHGFIGKEKPLDAIETALETVRRGHLAVDRLLLPPIPRPPHTEISPGPWSSSIVRRRSLVRPKEHRGLPTAP